MAYEVTLANNEKDYYEDAVEVEVKDSNLHVFGKSQVTLAIYRENVWARIQRKTENP